MIEAGLNIQKKLKAIPKGQSFSSADFLSVSHRNLIDQVIHRWVKQGKIRRLARGVYVKPKMNPYVGEVTPEIREVVQQMAHRSGHRIQTHGAEVARKLGLSTQVPAQTIFLTNGTSRQMKIGHSMVILKKVSERKLGPENSRVGEIVSLVWYLGESGVNEGVLSAIKKHLSVSELAQLKKHASFMPSWMAAKLNHI